MHLQKVKVEDLSWSELNRLLLQTEDETLLHHWVEQLTTRASSVTRALRVYGRLNYVRGVRERQAIKYAFSTKKVA
jgi:hypothetical protein